MIYIDYKKRLKKYWQGYIDLVVFTKWYEPIMLYPLQILLAIVTLIPYWGAKSLVIDIMGINEKKVKYFKSKDKKS